MTITLSPRVPDDQWPRDYAGLYAEYCNLDEVLCELMCRLEDHKCRWELYGCGLDNTGTEGLHVQAAVDELNAAVHQGGAIMLRAFAHMAERVPEAPQASGTARLSVGQCGKSGARG